MSVCLSRTSILSREQRPRKTKIGTEVANFTRDSDATFKVKRSKVKVTRPLSSPPCWRVSRLQRWAWERVGRWKLLLRCHVLGGARRFGPHGGGKGRGHIVAAPRTACFSIDDSNLGRVSHTLFREEPFAIADGRFFNRPDVLPVTQPTVSNL